jgi:uncharacterized protein (DUF2267 family)
MRKKSPEEFLANEEECMKYEEFVERVQERAHLCSPDEAKRAIRATLETLAMYISPKERHDAASQLPKGIKRYLEQPFVGPGQQPAPSPQYNPSVEDFYKQVSIREGLPLETAREHARAVMSVLRDALTEGEFEDIRAELPPELYNEFFAGSRGNQSCPTPNPQ